MCDRKFLLHLCILETLSDMKQVVLVTGWGKPEGQISTSL